MDSMDFIYIPSRILILFVSSVLNFTHQLWLGLHKKRLLILCDVICELYTKKYRMSVLKRRNNSLKANNDTGFSQSADSQGGRFINKDGSFNVQKRGIPLSERLSVYHKFLMMPNWKFMLVIFLSFSAINLFFTAIYFLMGPGQITGMISTNTWQHFKEIFFFSTQTFTTVGYGRINPVGTFASLISSMEALTGLLSFAIITGLLYGRFSRPRAYLRFSKHAVVAPYRGTEGLMFRFVSYKENHTLTEVEVKVTLGITEQENGKGVFKFYSLPLERSRVDSLPMNWTVVHPINEDSPLYGYSEEDYKTSDAEVYVLVRGFDDVFSNTVLQRTSYTHHEIIHNAKFEIMSHESQDDSTTILDMNKLDDIVIVKKEVIAQ
jgi:inward rectifier potassium channel